MYLSEENVFMMPNNEINGYNYGNLYLSFLANELRFMKNGGKKSLFNETKA